MKKKLNVWFLTTFYTNVSSSNIKLNIYFKIIKEKFEKKNIERQLKAHILLR